jgi:hypothetical protein
MKKLAKFADITVFTSRCAQDVLEGSTLLPGQLRVRVIAWLESTDFLIPTSTSARESRGPQPLSMTAPFIAVRRKTRKRSKKL